SYDGRIHLWRLTDRTPLGMLQGPPGGVLGIAVSPDRQWLMGLTRSGYDYTVHLWRLADGMRLKTQEGFSSWMTCLALSSDGQILVSGSGNGRVCLWPSPWVYSSRVAFLSHIPIEQTQVRDLLLVQDTLQ